MSNSTFEPRIIAFLCNWCTYTAADAAGVARMEQPANVDVIRVMCTGRIEPMFVLKAFSEGADGVIVSGCHPPGDCHYTNGNVKTLRRFKLLQRLLDQFGIERGRVRLEWVSASEGEKYARVVEQMTEDIRKLGPLKWREQMEALA